MAQRDMKVMFSGNSGNPKHISPALAVLMVFLVLFTGPFGIIVIAIGGLFYYAQKKKQTESANAEYRSYDDYVEHVEPHDCGDCEEHVMDRLESDDHPDLLDTLTDLVDRVKDGRNEDAAPEKFHSGEVYDAPLDRSRYDAAPGHTKKERLEQLETLRKAGLFTDEEYRTRKARIMKEP